MTTDYTPIERVTRTDFTADELWSHIESGDAKTINETHQRNPNYKAESEVWKEKTNELRDRLGNDWHRTDEYKKLQKDYQPSYYITDDNGQWKVFSEELVDLEDFPYEGGYVHGFGEFKVLDAGNLGDGHEAWALFQHKETGRLFRIGGWYSSWGDSGWDEFVEVEPAEVRVVRYKPFGGHDDDAYENPAVTIKT